MLLLILKKIFHFFKFSFFIFFMNFFFIFSCSGMFRNVPCSMFQVLSTAMSLILFINSWVRASVPRVIAGGQDMQMSH